MDSSLLGSCLRPLNNLSGSCGRSSTVSMGCSLTRDFTRWLHGYLAFATSSYQITKFIGRILQPCYMVVYPDTRSASGEYVIGAGVHLYSVYMTPPPQSLNGTLAVKSPFQTLAVDFSLNL